MPEFADPHGPVRAHPFQRDRWRGGVTVRAVARGDVAEAVRAGARDDVAEAVRADARDDVAEALLGRLRADDTSALDDALRRYWGPVLGYLTRWLGSADAAEDVAQRTFVRLWERRQDWRLDGSLRGLLFRVARNLAISDQRNLRARERAQERFARGAAPSPRGVLERLEDRQLGARLDVAIRELPARRREVFVLRCVHGFSHREIAALMGISEQTVANQLNRALATLRHLLADLLD